jgi:hypothetical protein
LREGEKVTRVPAFLTLAVLAAGLVGCTTTQKVVSGAAVGGGTGLLLGGPIGAAAGAAIGAVAAPVGSSVVSAD